jgi:hypothetical protein
VIGAMARLPGIAFALAALSAVLAIVLAGQAYHAFGFTKKDYLLNFSVGFLLLGLSYVILIPLALGVHLPGNFEDADDIVNYPIFAVMQTFGYIFIALAYSQNARARRILIGLMGALVALVVVVLLPGTELLLSSDILLYLLNTCLLGFVLYHMLKVTHPADLVFVGFLFLAIHEYTALIGQINEAFYNVEDDGSFFIAEMLRVSALCILVVSFLLARRRVTARQVLRSEESA